MIRVCPMCRQPVRASRLDVWLPPRKTQILDTVLAAGTPGITAREIRNRVYGRKSPRSLTTIRLHIVQINETLESTDWRIIASGRGTAARWHMLRVRGTMK